MRAPAAEYLIRQRVSALGRALPATRDGDATSLHRARVATRRLRAALPLVGSSGKADKLVRAVQRLTRALGPIRELDVSLAILAELEARGEAPAPAIDRLRASILEEREQLQAALRDRLTGFNFDKLRKRAIALARKGDVTRKAHQSKAPAVARQRAARRARRLAAAMENAAGLYLPDRLHEVRIAVKKLRYTLELASSAGNAARLRTLKKAQDLLGRMHDLEMLIAKTRAIQSSPGASTLRVSSDLDRLVRRLETECRQLHGHYMAARPPLLSLCERLIAAGRRRDGARESAA